MRYTVVATREGSQWLADAPEVPGTHTWARSLAGLDASVREAIALALDLPEGAEAGLELSWHVVTGDEQLDAQALDVRDERARLAAAESALTAKTEKLAQRAVG